MKMQPTEQQYLLALVALI